MKSIINPDFFINKDSWVVSLVRKPEGENPEHAFLIVEGANSFGRGIIKRYDLFMDKDNSPKAVIVIKESGLLKEAERQNYFNSMLKEEDIVAKTWKITDGQAEQLDTAATNDKKNPPDYQMSGNKSLIAKSHSAEGHSCFTWAREKLLNLNDPNITIEPKLQDFIAAQTSKYLPVTKNEEKKSTKCCVM